MRLALVLKDLPTGGSVRLEISTVPTARPLELLALHQSGALEGKIARTIRQMQAVVHRAATVPGLKPANISAIDTRGLRRAR